MSESAHQPKMNSWVFHATNKNNLYPHEVQGEKSSPIFANLLPFLCRPNFLLVELGADHPEWIEKYYSQCLVPGDSHTVLNYQRIVLLLLVGSFLVVVCIIYFVPVGGVIFSKFKVLNLFILLHTAARKALLYAFFFYLSWGYNYFRQPIEKGSTGPVTSRKRICFQLSLIRLSLMPMPAGWR